MPLDLSANLSLIAIATVRGARSWLLLFSSANTGPTDTLPTWQQNIYHRCLFVCKQRTSPSTTSTTRQSRIAWPGADNDCPEMNAAWWRLPQWPPPLLLSNCAGSFIIIFLFLFFFFLLVSNGFCTLQCIVLPIMGSLPLLFSAMIWQIGNWPTCWNG